MLAAGALPLLVDAVRGHPATPSPTQGLHDAPLGHRFHRLKSRVLDNQLTRGVYLRYLKPAPGRNGACVAHLALVLIDRDRVRFGAWCAGGFDTLFGRSAEGFGMVLPSADLAPLLGTGPGTDGVDPDNVISLGTLIGVGVGASLGIYC